VIVKIARGRIKRDRVAALLMVLALHGAFLYGLWSVRVTLYPAEAVPVFVTLISPSPPPTGPKAGRPTVQKAGPPAGRPASPRRVERQAPRHAGAPHAHLAVEAPTVLPTDATEPGGSPQPMDGTPDAGSPGPPSALPGAAGPVSLTSDLALVCPVRPPPPYPPVSRRLGETGKVVLRVELDETGRVSAAQLISSSGHPRLDDAALTAVKAWRCQPARRDGQAVRSVAVQPFDFTLQGH
jgi:protein TonB